MSTIAAKGTKIKIRFDDKTTMEYTTTQDLPLDHVLEEIDRLRRVGERSREEADRG